MVLSELLQLAPAMSAGIYTILLLAILLRQGIAPRPRRRLLAFLLALIAWQLLRFLWPPDGHPPNFSHIALLASLLFLALLTAAFLEWSDRGWLPVGVGFIVGILLIELARPRAILPAPPWLHPRLSLGGVGGLLLWAGVSLPLLARTWHTYRHTRLPWHANRLLFWLLMLWTMAGGELLLFLNPPPAQWTGQLFCLLAALGLAYAVATHRVFDVRHRLRLSISLAVTTVLIGLPAAGIFRGIVSRQPPLPPLTVAFSILLLAVASFALFQPLRRLLERLFYRYLPSQRFDTRAAVRAYSQAIARVLDVEQLSHVIIGQISERLGINRGALMLLSPTETGYELEPVPALGRLPRQTFRLPAASPFLQLLLRQRYPLLQYELDFNPAFHGLTRAEREWLAEQAMDVYVPVIIEGTSEAPRLEALIALGPKSSGLTFRPIEIELMQLLADQTGVALQNARLYRELGQQNEIVRQLNEDLVRRNERLGILDKVKSDFITIASHELRTPLTQVKGYADILAAMNKADALSREQTQEIVGHVNRAIHQLEKVISAMLDASQIDVQEMRLSFMGTGMETIVRLAVDPLRPALHERRLTLAQQGLDQLPQIQADFKRLVQAFQNVISNAIKYTPDGGIITIRGTLAPSAPDLGDFVEIVVADTGIGIDAQYHELIFEKFFRIGDPKLHSSGNTKFKGAGPGLGLPIARGVIEAHGGRVWVESGGCDEALLPGTEVHIVLPVTPPAARVSPPGDRPAWLVG
ncbi:MAG: GAF domain-containing sensor histidine kinase [Ardenticatenales bacterium]|nr:GAF domain-containing sensor histidine kinase [Ardenticatenales bacterium]